MTSEEDLARHREMMEAAAAAARQPRWEGESFECPRCSAFAQMDWRDYHYLSGSSTRVKEATCQACKNTTLWLRIAGGKPNSRPTGRMIWPPTRVGGPPAAADMPSDVRGIYDEARATVEASPRSASALLRLALESLLADLYPGAGRLNDQIGAAASDGLPPTIVKAMDVLRFNGNASIHEINREDTAETAASLFAILNLVVERLITEPRRVAEMHAQLPPGVLAQIERRDGTSSA